MTRRAKKKADSEPFELKKNAMEGIEEAVYWYTVGVVSDRGNGLGTAVAIRFRGQYILLTANHVIKDTADDDLGFFFRPHGTLKRTDWWQSSSPTGGMEAAHVVEIFHRFRDPRADLAALIVSPKLEAEKNIRFYDLPDRIEPPKRPSSVAAIGFPVDTLVHLGPGVRAVSPCPIWGNLEKNARSHLSGYNPRKNLLLTYHPAEDGRDPHGFSGAGIWHHEPAPKIWTPNLALAGIVTDYYRGPRLLLISRIKNVLAFLRKIAPVKSA
jgi:hypothetical protein